MFKKFKITKAQRNDLLRRAGKTFVQAYLGALGSINLLGIFEGESAKRVFLLTLISAFSAGCSALWNFILDIIDSKIEECDPDGYEAESQE